MNENLRPIIAPSDVERNACELMSTISTDGCEEKAKAAKLKATLTFDKPEPIPVPEFVRRQVASATNILESQLAALRERNPA